MFKYMAPFLCLLVILSGCISGTTVRNNNGGGHPASPSPTATGSTSPSPSTGTVSATVDNANPAVNGTVNLLVTGPASTIYNVTVQFPSGNSTFQNSTDANGRGVTQIPVTGASVGVAVQVRVTFTTGQVAVTSFTPVAATPTPSATPSASTTPSPTPAGTP